MEKIRSILSSASGKKQGPPVPPRPPKSTVQKALEKTRNQSHITFPLPPPTSSAGVPIAKGRTVIYTSTDNNNGNSPQQHVESQQSKCFDTKLHDSSTQSSPATGLKVIVATQNGNAARVQNSSKDAPPPPVMRHYKSPVPRPRLKTPPSPPSPSINRTSADFNQQNNSYTKLMIQSANRPPPPPATTTAHRVVKDRDEELKEKLLNEIFSGRLVEASNVHLRYGGNNLKRSSSCDVLNDRNSIIEMSPPTHHNHHYHHNNHHQNQEKSNDRKVEFHDILISELSEMRRENHRLSAAKSCSDLSPSSPKQVFTLIDMGRNINVDINSSNNNSNTCPISLEDSGVEDEEKPDDCSSSGVGDSWDSCKEMQNR